MSFSFVNLLIHTAKSHIAEIEGKSAMNAPLVTVLNKLKTDKDLHHELKKITTHTVPIFNAVEELMSIENIKEKDIINFYQNNVEKFKDCMDSAVVISKIFTKKVNDLGINQPSEIQKLFNAYQEAVLNMPATEIRQQNITALALPAFMRKE